jgi:hypothetical protein
MDSASHAPIELLRAFRASEITAVPPPLTRVLQGVEVAHVKSCREKGPRCIAVVEKPRVKKSSAGGDAPLPPISLLMFSRFRSRRIPGSPPEILVVE